MYSTLQIISLDKKSKTDEVNFKHEKKISFENLRSYKK